MAKEQVQAVFRKKSLDRVNSPEQLNEYIRVANPGVWVILAAVIVLLVGVCVWGVLGHLDTVLPAAAIAKDGALTVRLYRRYHTLDFDRICALVRKEEQ